jgi:hypothetical protein
MDTAGWFESQLPAAADQPEAKIELSSIMDAGAKPPTPPLPVTPSLTQAKTDALDPGLGGADPEQA